MKTKFTKNNIILFLCLVVVSLLFIPRQYFLKEFFSDDNKIKFIFDSPTYMSSLHINKENNIKFIFNKQSYFSLDTDCIHALQINHRNEYKDLANRYTNKNTLFDIEMYKNDYIIISDSIISNTGIIINKNGEIFANGGCWWSSINTNLHKPSDISKINSKEKTIISIASLWAQGIWHFPFEALVALKSIPNTILNNSKIHVSEITPFIIEWFKFLNIESSQLITGDVHAENIYIPRMGKCGWPYFDQIKWLQNIVHTHIQDKMPIKYVILIKRNHRRLLHNHDELEAYVKTFSKDHNLKLYIHDDNKLPSLKEQHKIFNQAKYVFAPHGAGGINLISMPKKSWYIEFLPVKNIQMCYTRLSYLLNINYIGISMKNMTIDIKNLNKKLSNI